MGFVVELCGLPGAGKSTVARSVVAQLRLRGVPATEVMAPLGPDAGHALRLARKTVAVMAGAAGAGSVRVAASVAFASGQQHLRDRFARPANLLVVRHAVRRAHRGRGVHVLDQGPLQEWWSAALQADDSRVLSLAAGDPAERADLVVRVDAPVAVVLDRLAARPGRQSRIEDLDRDVGAAELARGEVLLTSLSEQLVHSPRLPPPRLLRVDGRDRAAAERIVEAIVRAM